MNRYLTTICASTLWLSCLPGPAYADGLIACVPKRKSTAEYHVTEAWSDGTKRQFRIELKLIRSEKLKSQTGSFIECLFYVGKEKKAGRSFMFFLPDNKDFNHDFLENSPLVWSKMGGVYKRKDDEWDGFLPRLQLLFPPTAETETRTEKTVNIRETPFACTVAKGNASYTTRSEKTGIDYEIWRTDDVPFGVAHMILTAKSQRHGEPKDTDGELTFTLESFDGG